MSFFAALKKKLVGLGRDPRASAGIIFGLAMVPMVAMVGFAMDYNTVINAKVRLNAALDAAAISAITKTQADMQAGISQATAISDGEAQGLQTFNANAAQFSAMLTNPTSGNSPIQVAVNGLTITATGTYTASVPTNFGKMFNISTWTLSNSNSSTLKLPQYLDFYVMVDVSGSMGIPSTTSEQSRLAKINPDQIAEYPSGCTFACHFTTYKACDGAYCQGYILTRAGGVVNSICPTPGTSACIQLRLDAVGMAMTNLLSTASATEGLTGLSNQFRIGIYPFIVHMNTNYQPLSLNLTTTVTTAAQQIPSLLDTGNSTGSPSENAAADGTDMGSGGTNLNNALNEMYGQLPSSPGSGISASSTKPFVFLITDGAQDNQIMYNSNGSWTGSNHATVLTQSYCTTLQNRATLAILYVPYATIPNPNPNFAGDEDDAANNNIPNIPPSLSACASSGYFYTASSPTDINNALQQMFNDALQRSARLSQ